MANIDKIIQKSDAVFTTAESEFDKKVKASEQLIFDEILILVQELNIQAGRIKNDADAQKLLLSLENKIRAAFEKSGYNKAVYDLLSNFDTIAKNKITLHDVLNGKRITNDQINPIKRLAVQSTIDNLLGAGISKDLIYPIRQEIYRQALVGGTIKDAEAGIRKYILNNKGNDSTLLRYASQVATDSMNQFAGTIESSIKDEFGFNAYRYVGSIILDSRCQCRWWVKQEKISEEQLSVEIPIALNGGRLDKSGDCLCSGMIPGTNTSNFGIYRGGYRCRHKAIATNL